VVTSTRVTTAVLCVTALFAPSAWPQRNVGQGHPIGTISTQGKLIILELNKGALGSSNLFDLAHRTLTFKPDGNGYRISNGTLQWDPEFGSELKSNQVELHNFAFPFSGKQWTSFSVANTGAITFGPSDTGFPIARFDQLSVAAASIINTVPGIAVFLKPRMSGPRYVKESPDRVLVTWNLTEPWGGIQDFTWQPTVNRFQVLLGKDGSIVMSYEDIAARDAIVGIYPTIDNGTEKTLTILRADAGDFSDVADLKLSMVDDVLLRATLETRGPVIPEGDPRLAGLVYRIIFEKEPSSRLIWTIRGVGRRQRDGAPTSGSRYVVFGDGVGRRVTVASQSISVEGTLPASFLQDAHELLVSVETETRGDSTPRTAIPSGSFAHSGLHSPEVDLSALHPAAGRFKLVYEAFHYLALPHPRDLSCTVISALGDKFDFLAYYSDFRIDNQEAGTPSDGPMGGHVTGIGQIEHGLAQYCSAGRFQWGFIQPVYAGANQMQKYPPAGVKTNNPRDIDFYEQQLGERSLDAGMLPYNLAMSQIGHEMGHRWSAFVSARVNGETIPLGPTHWARGLQAPVAFPYQRPVEASAMGGGVWQDNFDGTFTQLDDDYYVPATGYSYLDLYLMGLIAPAEVPDFFLLRNLVPTGHDPNGHPTFKADRTKVTIADVIAAEGPRTPPVAQSQRKFNTGMVVVVEHGAKPSHELLERTAGIAKAWIDYWSTVTGRRASMTTEP